MPEKIVMSGCAQDCGGRCVLKYHVKDGVIVSIETADAEARHIRNGDAVRVFNDRGVMVIPAKVTERLMPGVVAIPEGAWYDPDPQGVDGGGCANVLLKDGYSPGGAFCSNTCLVQVEKA